MNDEFKPYPPLDLIEERLFAGPPTGTQEPHVETPREDALPPVGLSPWLRDRIAQVARTRSVPIPPLAQAGQILVSRVPRRTRRDRGRRANTNAARPARQRPEAGRDGRFQRIPTMPRGPMSSSIRGSLA